MARGKSSFRPHLATNLAIHALISWGIFSSFAGAQQSTEEAASKFPLVLESFIDNVSSMTASFEQEIWTADQRLVESSEGAFWIKRPDMFRWHYTAPIETLIVTNGASLWMYDVELEQVTRSSVDEVSRSGPAALLSGGQSVRDEFELVGTMQQDGIFWVSLSPKFDNGEFSLVRIGFDEDQLARLEFIDGLDQTTSIVFRDVSINLEISDSQFDFAVPSGVHVIGG